MINTTQVGYTAHMSAGGADTIYDMDALAKRFNSETKLLVARSANPSKKVLITKRPCTSYRKIIT